MDRGEDEAEEEEEELSQMRFGHTMTEIRMYRTTFSKPWKKLVGTLLWSLVRAFEASFPCCLARENIVCDVMNISGLTLVRDRMLTQSEQYCSVLKPCYPREKNDLFISLFS